MSTAGELPNWKLERYNLGELSHQDMAQVERTLAGSPAARQRLETLRWQDDEFRRTHDVSATAKRLKALASARAEARDGSQTASQGLAWLWKPAAALATIALVTLVGVQGMRGQDPPPQMVATAKPIDDQVRVKGLKDRIELWEKSGDTIALMLDGAKARKGDLLQIHYTVGKRCYGAILSLDGRGSWTRHLPDTAKTSQAMEPGAAAFLPFSYELDDAPRYEVFWLVTADKPFSMDSLLTSVRPVTGQDSAPAALPLDSRYNQTRLMVRK